MLENIEEKALFQVSPFFDKPLRYNHQKHGWQSTFPMSIPLSFDQGKQLVAFCTYLIINYKTTTSILVQGYCGQSEYQGTSCGM